MSIMLQLSSLALRGAGHATAAVTGAEIASKAGEAMVGFLTQRFNDNSKNLNRALDRAADRALRAVEVALAGHSWWDRCKLTLSTAQERAFREQVQAFLEANPLDGVNGFGPDFRGQCLAQLQAARKAGLFQKGPPPPDQLARCVGDLSRFGDPAAVVEAQHRCVARVAVQLREHGYEALATFLELRPAAGPPVLAAAVHYFFQREIEHDKELFQGLAYARLEGLSQGQSAGFSSLAEALDEHGERLEAMLADVHAVVVQTRDDVLDIKAEMHRQGQQMQELGSAVLRALAQRQLESRALHGGDSLSVRDEDERRLVKDLVRRYRALPADQRKRMPALLNAVGKLEVVAGEFESAERDFRELAAMAPTTAARAEAAHNAYLAALERRAWPDALAALKDAAALDPARFAPFPTEKFEPERILGAGGFGVAFLCRNTRSGGRVVIKTLRSDGLDRDLGEVFREAQTLEELEHPAIIRIRDCDFADAGRSRPYLVMDYFSGQTLGEYVEQNGPLSVASLLPLVRLAAEGLQRAHERGILHRDVKPANLLVRPSPAAAVKWDARLIDFGLAMRAQPPGSTRRASLDRTLAGASIAGTIEYAAPEQMGKLKGVSVGPYSDVFGFGKTCCFALFGTAQPTFQHWQQLPRELADLLGRCLNEQPSARPQNFASVLRDLDRLTAPRTQPVPPKPVARVMEAQAADVEPPRPVRRREEPPPAKRIPVLEEVVPVERRRPRFRPRDEEPAPTRARGLALVVVMVAGMLVVGAAALLLKLGDLSGPRVAPPVQPPPSWGPLPSTMIAPVPGVPGWPIKQAEPIQPEEFRKVLDELEEKPQPARLRELAGRLALTAPTDTQKQKHANYLKACALGGAGPGRSAMGQLESNDAILQVSRVLNPLLGKEAANGDHQLAAQALQKWGTVENVAPLIAALSTKKNTEWALRIELSRALAEIGDEQGVAPVASQLENAFVRMNRLDQLLIKFGPKAEPEVLKHIQSKDPHTRRAVCDVLKEIGTSASLEPLERATTDGLTRRYAEAALSAIKAREKK